MDAKAVTTDLLDLLERRRVAIVDDATGRLAALHLERYELIGDHEARVRLDLLYTRIVSAIERRAAECIVDYAAQLARERFATGYRIEVVQSAFDALEEAIWHEVSLELPAEEHAAALGLVSAAVGAGKDALGWTYTSLARHHQVPVLDVEALFSGTDVADAES